MLLKTLAVVGIAVFVLVERVPASDVVDVAAGFIGRPYVWGGEGPDAFDCSGLTQFVYREFAVDLPRRAVSQSRVGDPISRRMERGDLVFFSSDARKSLVTHVGIYEGGGRMIEASKRFGRVRRSDLDDPYWVERFMFARRITAVSGRPEAARERGTDGDGSLPSGRRRDARRAAVRALEALAGVLLRRPGR